MPLAKGSSAWHHCTHFKDSPGIDVISDEALAGSGIAFHAENDLDEFDSVCRL